MLLVSELYKFPTISFDGIVGLGKGLFNLYGNGDNIIGK